MKSVVAFKSRVNNITDTESELMTVSALFEIPRVPASDAPITIGRSGNIHGASTVNIPASTEIMKNII